MRLYQGGPQQYNNIIKIADDTVIEGTELLTVSLTNPQPPDAVATLGSTTIIINNNDFRELLRNSSTFLILFSVIAAHVGFEQTQYTTSEAKGNVKICISVHTGPLIESLTVKMHVRSSSAKGNRSLLIMCLLNKFFLPANDDFYLSESPPTIEIPSRASRGCQNITIISSAVVEHDEEIHLSISEDTLAVIEDQATTIVIKDGGCKMPVSSYFISILNVKYLILQLLF